MQPLRRALKIERHGGPLDVLQYVLFVKDKATAHKERKFWNTGCPKMMYTLTMMYTRKSDERMYTSFWDTLYMHIFGPNKSWYNRNLRVFSMKNESN